MTPITGSIVAIVTPMHEDGRLDLPALRKLVDFHVQEGTDAIVVVGTTGESPTVDVEEHHLLIETVVAQAAGRIPVIAGTGANSTAEAVEMTRFAKAAGADAALSVVPYYNKPTQEGLYRHYRAIAEAEQIVVHPEEVNAEYRRLAALQETPEAEIRKVLTEDAVAAALAAKKVQRFLLDHAEVTSVTDSAEKE